MFVFSVFVRWGDVYGSISKEVFSVGIPEEKLGYNGKQILSIQQSDTDYVHFVIVPGSDVVVVSSFHCHT